MAKRLTSGQITITDLNDGRVLSKYTNASQGYTQIYDSENKTYSVDYTKNEQVIKASVYASGVKDAADQAPTDTCSGWKWKVNGVEITSESASSEIYKSKNTLHIKKNLDDATKTFLVEWECTFFDTITQTSVLVSDGCTINRTASGSSSVYVNMLTPNGNVFDGSKNYDKLLIQASLMRGAKQDSSDLVFTWYKMTISEDGVLGWTKVTSGISTVGGVSTMTVGRDDVDGAQTYRVDINDTVMQDGTFQGFSTIIDKLDEYTVVLEAPAGTVIKNGAGSITITARVMKNNELMEDTSGLNFNWLKYDKSGKQSNWDGTSSPLKTGNPITVTEKDVNTKTTIICQVEQK